MENIRNYTFRFAKEAEALLQKFGAAGDYLLFADVRVTPPEDIKTPAKVEIPQALAGTEINGHVELDFLKEFYSHYDNPEALSSNSFPVSTEINGKKVLFHAIAVRDSRVFENFGKEYGDLMRLWTLLHETGHALSHGVKKEEDSPLGEITADAYAALGFLERFGSDAIPFISQMSWLRAFHGLHGDTLHMTSIVLDKIIVDVEQGKLPRLDTVDTVKLAKDYAREWTPETSAFVKAKESFLKVLAELKQRNIENLMAGTFLSSPNAVGDYAATKVLLFFLQKPDARYRDKIPGLSAEQRQGHLGTIRRRPTATWLRDLFGAAAARKQASVQPDLLPKMLPVRLFPGQKFNYRP